MPRRSRVINVDTYTNACVMLTPRMKRCIKIYMDQHGIKTMKEVIRMALLKFLEPCLEELPRPRVVSSEREEEVDRILEELEYLHTIRRINELGMNGAPAEEVDIPEVEEEEDEALGEEEGDEGGQEG